MLRVYETMHEKELEKRKQKAFAKEGADKLDYYVEAVREEWAKESAFNAVKRKVLTIFQNPDLDIVLSVLIVILHLHNKWSNGEKT